MLGREVENLGWRAGVGASVVHRTEYNSPFALILLSPC